MVSCKRALLSAVFVASSTLSFVGCPAAPQESKKDIPKVTTTTVIVKPLDDVEYFQGRTDAVDSVELRARVTGYVDDVKFKEGDEVADKAELYIIDKSPYQIEYDRLLADEKRYTDLLKEVLDPKYERERMLVGTGVSREEFEKTVGERLTAMSALTASKQAAKQAKLNLDWCVVKAPISGRIGKSAVTAGNLVNANVSVLTSIVSVDPMYCYFDVDENTLLAIQRRIREGSFKSYKDAKVPVFMGLSADRKADLQTYPYKGYLDFADNRIDPSTGTLKVRGVFDNPLVKDSRVLSPGLFARIKVPVGQREKALWVPDKSVVTEQGKKYLYVVNDKNIVEARPVFLLKLEGGMRAIEPIMVIHGKDNNWRPAGENEKGEDSLKAGERVIVSGLQRVRPGVEVMAEDTSKISDASQKHK